MRKAIYFILFFSVFFFTAVVAQDYLGQWSVNPYPSNSTANPYGAGSRYKADGVNNPYSNYGSAYSNESVSNPYALNAPKLYDHEGNYRGRLSSNRYDPESVSNPYGRYGSRYSPDSVNNPYGAGGPYKPDSPNNPYGNGWQIEGQGGVYRPARAASRFKRSLPGISKPKSLVPASGGAAKNP